LTASIKQELTLWKADGNIDMTGKTIAEKIIARAAGLPQVKPGDEVWVTPDRMSMNDTTGPRRIASLVEDLGGLWDKDKVILASDHFTPAGNIRQAEILKLTREWAQTESIENFYEFQGILHNLILQEMFVLPGMLLVGADSHTLTAGAIGALAVAVGSTELATVLATGKMWMSVPESVHIKLSGELSELLDVRDITMKLLQDFKSDFALYSAIEYEGDFIEDLSLDDRLVLTNQGIEMGAKNAIVPATQSLLDAISVKGVSEDFQPVYADDDAIYKAEYHYDLNDFEPLIALPHTVDNVVSVSSAPKTQMDHAWIGSCVGGRYEDLKAAANVLKGQKVQIPLSITPATLSIYKRALNEGILQILLDSGAVILPPGCGACAGLHSGVAAKGENVIATATRNFRGRMGSRDSSVYLASPYTVAASAITGKISDPREIALSGELA